MGEKLIKKILVAFDGSLHADQALNFALDLAEKYSAVVQILTVIPPILLPTYSFHMVTGEAIQNCTEQLETSFKGVLSKAFEREKKEKPKLKLSAKLVKGNPDERIVETAESEKFNIIVMGSRGLGRRELHLGSVSDRVANNATCGVLIVKQ